MSGTRSPSRKAQATDPSVLIVAHGSPSEPDAQEEALAKLAAEVDAAVPGIRVGGTTLAAPGAFDAAVERLGAPLLYPFFMADGYFVRRVLAEKAAQSGLTVLPPFGHEPGLIPCIQAALAEHLTSKGWQASETTLLVAAHGSAVSQKNAATTLALTAKLHESLGFANAVAGFVEQEPFLGDVIHDPGQAICLPFFALRAGHYVDDVPEALALAEFSGPVLPPLIEWPQTSALIAQSLSEMEITT